MGTYIEKPKKAPLKTEFIVQLKALEKEHEALKLENIKNLETIHELENKVVHCKKKLRKNPLSQKHINKLSWPKVLYKIRL